MKKILPFVISLIAGCLYALAYPSFISSGHFIFVFLGLIPFLYFIEDSVDLKKSAIHIICYNLGLNLTGYYWIPHTLQEFGQLPYLLSLFIGLFFTFILQPHWWVYLIWKKFRPQFNWNLESGTLITATVLTILERFVPQQFPSYVGSPWLHLAPYLGLAPYFGCVLYSFLTYWISLEIIQQLRTKKIRLQVWITTLILVILNVAFPLNKNLSSNSDLNLRIVQANIGNFIKISSEYGDQNSYQSVRQKYFKLSTENLQFKPDLIIWPETAYPDTFFGKTTNLNFLFKIIMKKTGAEILLGGYDHDLSKPRSEIVESVFNSAILLSDLKFKESYHKNILIPFGETLPFGPFNKTIVSMVPAISLFARGDDPPLMETKKKFRFVTPICYEILDTNYMRFLLNKYQNNHFIVNLTNDSWYGKTAEPYQHLFLSKWRALEFSLPIIRSTNTGITSVIYPDGSESERIGIFEERALDLTLPISSSENSIYQKLGLIPLFIFITILILLTLFREKREIRP